MANSDTLSPAHRGEWRVIIGSIRPAWLLKMLLISGMKLLENGLKAMTNNFPGRCTAQTGAWNLLNNPQWAQKSTRYLCNSAGCTQVPMYHIQVHSQSI